jgi:hypothetical protein
MDATAGETLFRCQRNRAVIFVLIEGHDCASIANLLDKEQRLIGRNDLLDRQGSHTSVDFRGGVPSSSGFLLLMRGGDQVEARLMIRVTSSERGDQHGCIEGFLLAQGLRRGAAILAASLPPGGFLELVRGIVRAERKPA